MRRAFALLMVLGGFAVACQLLAGIDRVEKEDSPPDVVVEVPAPPPPPPTPPDPCKHVTPPDIPLNDDAPETLIGDAAGGNKEGELYFALRSVNLGIPPGAPNIGYDLDGVCTCEKKKPTAHDGGSSCTVAPGAMPTCDDDGGIDNALVVSVAKYSGLVDIDQAANINARIGHGQQNGIIIITKYNGRANDKDVGVGIFKSEGIIDDHDGGTGVQPGCPDAGRTDSYWTPGWCGTDRWSISSDSVTASGKKFQPNLSGDGYVSNYTLVVRFEGTAIVPFGTYQLTLGSPVTTGHLVPLDENQVPIPDPAKFTGHVPFWRIEDGILAGRVPVSEILAAVGTLALPGSDGGQHLCDSPLFGTFLKSSICPAVDLGRTSKLDFEPGVPCDAISTTLRFRADPVVVDAYIDPKPEFNECYPNPEGTAPIEAGGVTYTCP